MPLRFSLTIGFVLFAGCTSGSDRPPAAAVHASATSAASATPAARIASRTTPKLPAPPAVLEAIFQDPGDHSASYDVGNGSRATYWYGYGYDLDGTSYFTGFVQQSPDHFAGDTAADDPPSAKATLTQATFVRAGGNGWTFRGAQRSIGEVGSRGRADAVDESRPPIVHRLDGGRLLLGVPTDGAIEQGTVLKNYELLLRRPDGAWAHVGTLNAGQDDSAGCDGGRIFPCSPISGQIFIDADDQGDMPRLRVVLTHGASRRDDRQTVIYRFDKSSSSYVTATN